MAVTEERAVAKAMVLSSQVYKGARQVSSGDVGVPGSEFLMLLLPLSRSASLVMRLQCI